MSTTATGRGRPKLKLTLDERNTLGKIKQSHDVPKLFARLQTLNRNSKEARLELGRALRIVRDKLATAGRGGLFTKFLTVRGIAHAAAYEYIALAGGGRSKLDSPYAKRRNTIAKLLNTITQSDTDAAKRSAFRAVCSFIKKAYGVT
jgi:homoserine kinase